jgi:hypothetical protein
MPQSHRSECPVCYSTVLDHEADYLDEWLEQNPDKSSFNIHVIKGVQAYLRERAKKVRNPKKEEENE